MNILLVDDKPENLLAIEAVLTDLGATLIRATSGESALKHLLEREFAVILLDVQMHGIDGYETARLIKQRERSAQIPIIFLAGVETEPHRVFQGYTVGAVDYLVKPIIPEVLRAKISVFIELFRKTQQLEAANEALRQQLQTVAHLTDNAVEQERRNQERTALLETVERARQHMSFLSDASAILASSLDYETTLSTVARLAVPKLADWCSVHILQEDGTLKQVAVQHVDPDKITWAYHLQERYPTEPDETRGLYYVLKTGKSELLREIPDTLLVAAAKDEEHLRILRKIGFSSAMTVPLVIRGQVIGIMSFVFAEGQQHYDDDALHFAQELAHHCALAVENARLYRAANQQQERLQVTLTSIGDALITTDSKGYVTLMNPVAEALTGWTLADAIGQDLTQVFNIVNETTGELVESPVSKVLRDGRIAGLANHTLLIARDGRETPIDDSGAPIRDSDGHIIGVVLVFRDISERKQAEIALQQAVEFHRRLEEKLTLLIESSSQLLQSLEFSSVLQAVLDFSSQIVGADAYAVWRLNPITADWQIIVASGLSVDYQRQQLANADKIVPFETPIVVEDLGAENLLSARSSGYQQEGIRSLLTVPLRIHSRIAGSIVFYHRQPHRYTEIEVRIASAYANIVAAAIGSAELYQKPFEYSSDRLFLRLTWVNVAQLFII